MKCEDCRARGTAIYCAAAGSELEEIVRTRVDVEQFEKGAMIITDESRSEYVFTLKSGWAYRYVLLGDGRRQILDFFREGDFLSIGMLSGSRVRSAVRALTMVSVCRFARASFLAAVDRYPRLRRGVLAYLRSQEERTDRRCLRLGALNAEEAVASLVLEFAGEAGRDDEDGDVVPFPLTLALIADAIGITEIHAGRIVRGLERAGAIERLTGNRLRLDTDRLHNCLRRAGGIAALK